MNLKPEIIIKVSKDGSYVIDRGVIAEPNLKQPLILIAL
jgi:hypothetical protein